MHPALSVTASHLVLNTHLVPSVVQPSFAFSQSSSVVNVKSSQISSLHLLLSSKVHPGKYSSHKSLVFLSDGAVEHDFV